MLKKFAKNKNDIILNLKLREWLKILILVKKSDSFSEKSIFAIFNYWKLKLISNESCLTESDSLYPESINNTKDKIKKKDVKRVFRKEKNIINSNW